jgi:formylglycine-generating enzyme required for sulfatase activity
MGTLPDSLLARGDDLPIHWISWADAIEFLEKLNKLEGVSNGTYYIPDEISYEYCARGGTSSMNFVENSNIIENSTKRRIWEGNLHPPNAWGLYGTHSGFNEFTSTTNPKWKNSIVTRGTGLSAYRSTCSMSGSNKYTGLRIFRTIP